MGYARLFVVAGLSLWAAVAGAAQPGGRELCEKTYPPQMGQRGKDVIWIPTLDELVRAMLNAAGTGPDDFVIDLGSGDGKIPIAAARDFGARALGIEYDARLVKLAQCYVRAEELTDKVEIRQADIFETDFSRATVLTLYLLTDLNLKLRPTILKMKPGTRVVSNSFKMGDWSPDEFIESEIGNTRAYLWIVPADVAGAWTFREQGGTRSFVAQLGQRYQEVNAVVNAAAPVSVRDVKLRGTKIELTVVGLAGSPMRLAGEVSGSSMRVAAGKVSFVGTR
jgi:methyltransferase family protein